MLLHCPASSNSGCRPSCRRCLTPSPYSQRIRQDGEDRYVPALQLMALQARIAAPAAEGPPHTPLPPPAAPPPSRPACCLHLPSFPLAAVIYYSTYSHIRQMAVVRRRRRCSDRPACMPRCSSAIVSASWQPDCYPQLGPNEYSLSLRPPHPLPILSSLPARRRSLQAWTPSRAPPPPSSRCGPPLRCTAPHCTALHCTTAALFGRRPCRRCMAARSPP